MSKAASPKQLAARAKFSEAAKSRSKQGKAADVSKPKAFVPKPKESKGFYGSGD